ncbi:uncharacterized protein LOC128236088 isoform X2 [Mya arenaria]|uniref:uncharacterized protein LOC128236088 isoform X2 n=1 Tax=Mya arenaria TaxID=6604 RepID=UPI0022E0A0C6|nr:uncharacterized protein LOC128236088 isoform X2 [Mya arenaria]
MFSRCSDTTMDILNLKQQSLDRPTSQASIEGKYRLQVLRAEQFAIPDDVDIDQASSNSATDQPVHDHADDLHEVPSAVPGRVVGQTNPAAEGLTILAEGPSQRQPAVGHSLREPTFSMTAQTARGVVHCCECNKPQLYYRCTKLTCKHNLLIAKCISEFTFTCGAPIAHPSYLSLRGVLSRKLTCGNPIAVCSYANKLNNKVDVCCHCGDTGGVIDTTLIAKFKSVLPICENCLDNGKHPITQRPYGK